MNMLHSDVLKWASYCNVKEDRIPNGFLWTPTTLKQISTSVLALGKATGAMANVMPVLASIEARLSDLRIQMGIIRSHPVLDLPRVTVLVHAVGRANADSSGWEELGRGGIEPETDHAWISLGAWVPDILDRAAGFDPLHELKSATNAQLGNRVFTTEELIGYHLDHVIVLDINSVNKISHPVNADPLFVNSVKRQESDFLNAKKALTGVAAAVHFSAISESWLCAGPDVFNAVFEAAEFIHGIKK